jgi:tRNA threonylcarbamoyladenosine biosynthesis protein TsaE
MGTFISDSPEATETLGETWGREARAGWVLALSGDLGAGKTQLVRGVARGLGVPARVHSPTFTLLNLYEGGRLGLYHLDLYRLGGPGAVFGAGLEEYLFTRDGVVVVEWAERWLGVEPRVCPRGIQFLRRVLIEVLSDDQRRIVYEDTGG